MSKRYSLSGEPIYPRSLGEITHLSKSSIELFESCPHRWAYEYLLGNRGPKDRFANIGTAMHAVIESYLRHESSPIDISVIPQDELPSLYSYLTRLTSGHGGTIGVELELRLKFNEEAPPILAYVDHLYSDYFDDLGWSLVIEDHKSNRRFEDETEWRKKLQPQVYGWMVRNLYQQETVCFKVGYVNLGKTVIFQTSSHEDQRVVHRLNRAWEKMKGYAKSLEEKPLLEDWPATVSSSCQYCQLKGVCKSFRNALYHQTEDLLFHQLTPLSARLQKLKEVQGLIENEVKELKKMMAE